MISSRFDATRAQSIDLTFQYSSLNRFLFVGIWVLAFLSVVIYAFGHWNSSTWVFRVGMCFTLIAAPIGVAEALMKSTFFSGDVVRVKRIFGRTLNLNLDQLEWFHRDAEGKVTLRFSKGHTLNICTNEGNTEALVRFLRATYPEKEN
jgi:hypothetical protein